MKCLYCGGKMEQELAILDLMVDGGLYIVDNVPAYVCQRCGGKVIS